MDNPRFFPVSANIATLHCVAGGHILLWLFCMRVPNVGVLGESAAAHYLKERGFSILSRNFRARCGELDIVAHFTHLHIVEVKTRTVPDLQKGSVAHFGQFRPEFAIHRTKQTRIRAAARLYCVQHHTLETAVQFDVAIVYYSKSRGTFRISYYQHAFF